MKKKDNHNYVVDVIRFIAAIFVIFEHSFRLANNTYDPLDMLTNKVVHFGATSVAIFFTFSGYFIAKSLIKNGDKNYISKRLKRIIPELLIVVLFTIFVIGPVYTNLPLVKYFTNLNTYKYLLNAFMIPIHSLPGVFSNNIYGSTINGALWTLSVEFLCYIYLLIVYKMKLLNEKRINMVYICSIFLGLFGLVFISFVSKYMNVELLKSAIRPFLVFITASFIGVKNKKIDVRLFIVSLFVLLCSILSSNYYLINASYIVFLPISVIYISNEVSLNGSKPIKFLGEISYPVYLFGFAVQQCIVASFGGSMSPYLNFVISTIISIILGGLLNCLMTVLRKKYKWL